MRIFFIIACYVRPVVTHTHTRTHAHAEAHDVDVVVVVVDDVFKTCVVVVVFIGSTQLVPNFIPVPT